MIEYVHIPCQTVVATYAGDKPIASGQAMRKIEWRVNGKEITSNKEVHFKCVGCGSTFSIHVLHIEPKRDKS